MFPYGIKLNENKRSALMQKAVVCNGPFHKTVMRSLTIIIIILNSRKFNILTKKKKKHEHLDACIISSFRQITKTKKIKFKNLKKTLLARWEATYGTNQTN